MIKKLVLGLLIGALLVYLSVRGIRFDDVVGGFKTIKYGYIVPPLIIFFLMQVLRAWRWGIILSPLAKVDRLSLFSVTSVGFLAIVSIPARIGELARPYLITKKSHIKMTAALGTIFVERIFDSLACLCIFVFTLFSMPLPSWLIRASLVFFLIIILIITAMILLIVKREVSIKVLSTFFNRLPDKYAVKVNHLINHFIDGFAVITDGKRFFSVMLLSAAIWLINGVAIYFIFMAFSFSLPIVAAFVLMIIIMVGIAIPTAPGFIGNWHYFCILGLALFGIPKSDAFAFAVIYHFLSIGIVVFLGLIFLPFNKFSLANLRE
jgi:glycosyltransferase 2 family protein